VYIAKVQKMLLLEHFAYFYSCFIFDENHSLYPFSSEKCVGKSESVIHIHGTPELVKNLSVSSNFLSVASLFNSESYLCPTPPPLTGEDDVADAYVAVSSTDMVEKFDEY
jgi:hypothetical protein